MPQVRFEKPTCMWADGVYQASKQPAGEFLLGSERGVWLTRTVRRKLARARWNRDHLSMFIGVPNDGDPKVDDGSLKGEVVVMDKVYRENLGREADVPVPRRVYTAREGWTVVSTVRRGTARQSPTDNCRKRNRDEAEVRSEVGGRGDEMR